jgi:hypothetical protein
MLKNYGLNEQADYLKGLRWDDGGGDRKVVLGIKARSWDTRFESREPVGDELSCLNG